METFDYEDVQLIPNKCILKSRKEADTRIKFGPRTFKFTGRSGKHGKRDR